MDDGIIRPQDLVPHCHNYKCSWCDERRARERVKMIEETRAARNSPPFDHWKAPIPYHTIDVLQYWPATRPGVVSERPEPIYLKTPRPEWQQYRRKINVDMMAGR